MDIPADPKRSIGSNEANVEDSFQLVDQDGRQRFLAAAYKPPALMDGEQFERRGPDGTYLIFNDENGTEKGGIIGTSTGALVSLDYPNADAIHLETDWDRDNGGARLLMNHMPDRALRPDEARTRPGVNLYCNTEHGTGLQLNDSQGRPRIILQVDAQDVPRICVLDEAGEVITRFPDS